MYSLVLLALLNPALTLVCNGTGELYQDSTGCECDETFGATSEGCAADADGSAPLSLDGGNPLVLQEWWQNSSFASGDLNDWLSYRPGYGPPEALMPRLEATIRALHVAEGNVDATIAREYHLVVGAGSTNVLTALLFAAASEGPADPSMFVRAPHWFHYSHLAAMNLPFGLHWATTPANATIHINTWPNNPDGSVHPVSAAADATTIVDCAYNWRSWGAEQVLGSSGVDAALFTLSKLTGHAGTRFGWALVRDEALAASARRWLGALQLQPASNLAIAQALRLLTPVADGSASLLGDTRAVMKERAVALATAQAACPSPRATNEAAVGFFYAWFRCTRPADADDCAGALAAAVGVHGHFGADFGATNASVRIPLVQHTAVWQQSTLPRLSRFLCH